MKRTNKLWLTVLLTVLVAALLAAGLTAAAENTAAFEDAAVISTNVPQTLSFSGNGRETVYLKFTPEDAGSYTLSCTGGDAIFYTWLFDADGELLESGSYFNGFLGYGLEAGKTYFYQIDSYDNIIAEVLLSLTEDYMADRSTPLTPGGEVIAQSYDHYASFTPEATGFYVITVEDPYHEKFISINALDYNLQPLPSYSVYGDPLGIICKMTADKTYYFKPSRPGQVFRVETLQSYSSAQNWEPISLERPFTVDVGEDGSNLFVPFTPSETKQYTLVSDDGCSTQLVIYDSDFRSILYYPFDASSHFTNVRIPAELTAGETYYYALACGRYETAPGSFASRGTYTLTVTDPNAGPSVVDSGYCGGEGDGTNLIWTLDSEGTLTISGTGAMDTYSFFQNGMHLPPWIDYAGEIKHVVVENGVTTISSYAFIRCGNLKSVVLPCTLETIFGAFDNCNRLTDVYYAGSEAQWSAITIWSGNDPLLNARIHYNVVDRGFCGGGGAYNGGPDSDDDITSLIWAFDGSTLTISGTGTIQPYGEYADGEFGRDTGAPWYQYRESLRTVILEEGVKGTDINSFTGCTALENVVIPKSLKTVFEVSFWMCGSIKNVFYAGDEAQWNMISFPDIDGPGDTGNDDLLNAHRHYNATWHTPGAAVIENEAAATCTEAGGYDEVVYCTQCPCELSRNHVTVDPLDHPNRQEKPKVLPRKGRHEHGHEAGVWCPDCNRFISGGETIHNQDGEHRNEVPATVDAPGSVWILCDEPDCMEWGLYELPQLKPDDPGNGGSPIDNIGKASVWDQVISFAKQMVSGPINVLLKLIRWLGKIFG